MDWVDLLAVPFRHGGDSLADGLDCWGQAVEVNRRLGRAISARDPSVFVRVDGCEDVGDILASDPERFGFISHVSTVVAPNCALSTSIKHGPYTLPLHRVGKELGSWRPK